MDKLIHELSEKRDYYLIQIKNASDDVDNEIKNRTGIWYLQNYLRIKCEIISKCENKIEELEWIIKKLEEYSKKGGD